MVDLCEDILIDEVLPEVEEVEQILSENEIKEGDYDGEKELYRTIPVGDDSDNLFSSKVVSLRGSYNTNPYLDLLDDYDEVLLYNNDNGLTGSSEISIPNLNDYDFLVVKFKAFLNGYTVPDYFNYSLMYAKDLLPGANHEVWCIGFRLGPPYSNNVSNSTGEIYCQSNQDKLLCSLSSRIHVYQFFGYKKKEVVEPEPTPTPTPVPEGGNTIINNNYYTVSCDSVSDNILTKKLNEYSTAESMCAMGILLALGVIIGIVIKKSIIRWQ